jgi:hypothetical protein
MPEVVRHNVDFDDANNFVTGWIQKLLLDVTDLYKPAGIDSQLAFSVPAVASFRDRNKDADIPAIVFWPQKYEEELGGFTVKPVNVYKFLDNGEKVADFMGNLLKKTKIKRLEKIAGTLEDIPDDAFFMTRVPPDVDCTMMYLDIGGKLMERASFLPRSKKAFFQQKVNWRKLANLMVDISYTPFKATKKGNEIIDPRTYMWMHPFLVKEKKAGRSPLIVTTWMTTIQDDRARNYENMIWNVNNVDLTESCNVLNGISRIIQLKMTSPSPLSSFMTADIQKMFIDTARLVKYGISSGIAKQRLDLVPLYYPHFAFFNYAAARFASIQADFPETFQAYPKLAAASQSVLRALKRYGTNQLLGTAQSIDSDSMAWHSALGTDDRFFGFKINKGDDYIYSTGVAVDALITIWARRSKTACGFSWGSDTPQKVKDAVQKGLTFLLREANDDNYEKLALFFSADFKGKGVLPISYPSNFHQYINGTFYKGNIHDNVSKHDLPTFFSEMTVGVKGFIPNAEYQKMLKQKFFGQSVQTESVFLPKALMPIWSSESMTNSVAALAILRATNLC